MSWCDGGDGWRLEVLLRDELSLGVCKLRNVACIVQSVVTLVVFIVGLFDHNGSFR